ncbi:hypothetical protein, partial [Pseudomonas fragi]|uniref:hypothetical protein n=1 Tax=Pseudomonas fragi TaxID=296 RepID=UPI001EEEC640
GHDDWKVYSPATREIPRLSLIPWARPNVCRSFLLSVKGAPRSKVLSGVFTSYFSQSETLPCQAFLE